ncbi:MAG: Gfo/Idh/MocA family oxidoreductase [Candidatus Ratteibacteria bacterium]|nr:Gfo/Idh/MocA family oxidoreductase [Candidatus Ratteibacteria bacterium]
MVKIGIIGAGYMGSMHATVYSQLPDAKVVGIADIRGEKAKSLATKVKALPYSDPQQLLEREDITTIDICLPTFLHKEFVIKAAEKGKDVICEKPIALDIEDANEMIEACKKHRVRFMVAQVIRFWAEYKFLKEIYDRKKYGELITLSCRRLSSLPTWGWQDWILDSNKSGGALIDLHIHDTDFICYLMGKKPKKIYSKSINKERPYSHVYTTFTFDNDIIITAEGGWDYPANFPFEMSYLAKFEKAVVEFNSRNTPSLTVYEVTGKVDKPTFEKVKAEGIGGNIDDLGGYFYELRYFVDHVIHNKPFTVVTPEDARNSLAIVLKEKESADKGCEIIL